MKIALLTTIRNDSNYVPGMLEHVYDHVDGLFILDDSSDEPVAPMLKRYPKVTSVERVDRPGPPHLNEARNRKRLLNEASKSGFDWALVCDADERFELRFLREMRNLIDEHGSEKYLIHLKVRDLWDGPDQYRVDGIWATKSKCCLLPCVRPGQYYDDGSIHCPWYPPFMEYDEVKLRSDFNLYHLRSLRKEDRVARAQKFKSIDPCSVYQSQGYSYMLDEKGLELRKIDPSAVFELTDQDKRLVFGLNSESDKRRELESA